MSIQLPVRLSLLAASVMAAAIFTSSTAQADDRAPWPGLPYLTFDPDRGASLTPEWGWLGTGQVGMAGSVRGKQWAPMPLTMVAVNAVWTNLRDREAGPGEPTITDTLNSYAFLVSPEGSVGGHNYGDSALIPVRTVAFGSVPVEATLQVSQLRDAAGIPDELELVLVQRSFGAVSRERYQTFDAVNLKDEVVVRLRGLKLDGVDVGLEDSCRTSGSAQLDVTAVAWRTQPGSGDSTKQWDPMVGMLGQNGAHLEGSIDIPGFAGCTTAGGDDLSGVVSSVLAGDDNPVIVQVGAQGCFHIPPNPQDPYLPPGPGETTPEAAECYIGPMVPGNPGIKTIPDPLPFPDHAPGDQP